MSKKISKEAIIKELSRRILFGNTKEERLARSMTEEELVEELESEDE